MENKTKGILAVLAALSIAGLVVTNMFFNSADEAVENVAVVEDNIEDEESIVYAIEWSDDKSGVITTISHAVIEEREDVIEGGTYNLMGVHFKLQNQSDKPLTTYPDQGKLVIGETQIDSNMFASDSLGGELLNGATKEGYVAFKLPSTINADELSEIRLVWSHYASFLDDTKYDVTLTLNKFTP